MRYSIIRDGIVENIIEWDGETEWEPPEGTMSRLAEPDDVIIVIERPSWL